MPSYLKEYEMDYGSGGFCPIRWHPEVVSRTIALGKAISEKFDAHPNFEGLAIPETSLDLSDDDYLRFEYTPEKEVKNLIQKKAELVPGFF